MRCMGHAKTTSKPHPAVTMAALLEQKSEKWGRARVRAETLTNQVRTGVRILTACVSSIRAGNEVDSDEELSRFLPS